MQLAKPDPICLPTPEKLAATMKGDITRMGKVIKDAGIRAD